MERPKKDNPPQEDDIGPPEVLTDVFHCPPDVDKFTHDYNTTDYGLPGKPLPNSRKLFQTTRKEITAQEINQTNHIFRLSLCLFVYLLFL